MENMKCYICGKDAWYCCDDCERPLCEDCTASSSPPNPTLEESVCKSCWGDELCNRGESFFLEEERLAQLEEYRKERNRKAREVYALPENVEKRRLRKIYLEEKREAHRQERIERLVAVFKDIEETF